MELLGLIALGIIGWWLWRARSAQRAEHLKEQAEIQRATRTVEAFATRVAQPAEARASLAEAWVAASAAVEAAETAARASRESVDQMRQLLAAGYPAGVAWSESGERDPSRDLREEAEEASQRAVEEARSARQCVSSGSAHSWVLGEVAIHVFQAADATDRANATAYDAVESTKADKEVQQGRGVTFENARSAALGARKTASVLAPHTRTIEPAGSPAALIAGVVETHRVSGWAASAFLATSAAESSAYEAIGKLEKAATRAEVELLTATVRYCIEDFKHALAAFQSARDAAGGAADAAEAAWDGAFDAWESSQALSKLSVGSSRVRGSANATTETAKWLAEAASEAATAARDISDDGVDDEGQPMDHGKRRLETLEWSFGRAREAAGRIRTGTPD